MNGGIRIDEFVRLMPMHLVLDDDGAIISAGPTLRKLIGQARRFDDVFILDRPQGPPGISAVERLGRAGADGRRLFLRIVPHGLLLRGHAVSAMGGARLILNLGFGIALPQAVRQYDLTDADFAPSDLAMELLFLYEANSLAGNALADANERMDLARRDAEARSSTDPLTGLANRRGLDEAMDAILEQIGHARRDTAERRHADARYQGFTLIHLDLDHFKEVNDSFGHAMGDAVLRRVADVLRAAIRTEDTAARSGGDEFVLLLPGVMPDAQLRALGERIIAQIELPIPLDGDIEARVSASIGIAILPGMVDLDRDALAARADAALYAAKRTGRGRAILAHRDMPL